MFQAVKLRFRRRSRPPQRKRMSDVWRHCVPTVENHWPTGMWISLLKKRQTASVGTRPGRDFPSSNVRENVRDIGAADEARVGQAGRSANRPCRPRQKVHENSSETTVSGILYKSTESARCSSVVSATWSARLLKRNMEPPWESIERKKSSLSLLFHRG